VPPAAATGVAANGFFRGGVPLYWNVAASGPAGGVLHPESLMTELMERITLDPAVRSGKPVIRGTRITVSDVLEYLAGGMTPEEVLADFPDLAADDIRAVLAFAAQREHRLFSDS
jgi:uncharacterized protein (DUF433 family)